jgi:hypothetical protein
MQLRRLLQEEEARLADLSETKDALERKRKADEEAAELEAKIAEMRAKYKQETAGSPATPTKVVFPKAGTVVTAVKLGAGADSSRPSVAGKPTNGGAEAEHQEEEVETA